MKKLIVLGACSAIAQQVERLAAKDGKELLLVGRSADRLIALRQDLLARGATAALTLTADFEDIPRHQALIEFAAGNFPDFDTVLVAYGSMLNQNEAEHSPELIVRQLHTDLVSMAALLTVFAGYFEARRSGCLAVITSVAGDRPRRANYVYGTAKAAMTYFLVGLRGRLRSVGVRVITIKPGPVRTKMTAHLPQTRIFADPERVARDIYRVLNRRSPEIVYTPFYWRYIMRGLRLLPEFLFNRLFGK
jgi:decaprenylphospho-beta-D-erythro-pentofuranosid-2-ulose 2-reductase